ncbi:DUF1801 domain-containing protein [Sphingobacterium litopenaei]|uniref:DUF1801 domain-containing protein n=1 Tax=Sphingobacterium litopenaei TaxID=2763500 RepID=A0ABR7YH27_9SPHI|nr:DUF1801 domain-containing protein [Sphingobacterium litopenaei]MBD1430620.1 DUF1801 domain-containing protein [Sphingobacterium litopenaei]
MSVNKTHYTEANVLAFIETVDNLQKKEDSLRLIELMETALGEKAKMFGPSIIGFGKYHYKYDSGHEGEAPILGFSPRKAAISLYLYSGSAEQDGFLTQLGKFKMGKACIYVKKLSDINLEILQKLMASSIDFISKKYQRILE